MRTYEVTMQVITYETVTVEHDGHENHTELLQKAQEKLEERGVAGETRLWRCVENLAARPKTDKQRFNDAFKELRSIGYKAKQNGSPHDTDFEETHVITMRDDAKEAFEDGKLTGMMPIHWDSDRLEATHIEEISGVFERHGFVATWGGDIWSTIEITGGEA